MVEFNTTGNVFFDSLEAGDRQSLAEAARVASLQTGRTLCEAGRPFATVFLPTTTVVSIILQYADGRDVEVRSVGNESIVGVMAAISGSSSETTARVQITGDAVAIPADRFRERALQSSSLLRSALQFAQANLSQTERTVGCRSLHGLSSRLARWLLVSQDRVGARPLLLNQDYMSVMTGALRTSVSVCAGEFKKAGLIDYRRGRVEILDRPGLEAQACDCYLKDRQDRLKLGSPVRTDAGWRHPHVRDTFSIGSELKPRVDQSLIPVGKAAVEPYSA